MVSLYFLLRWSDNKFTSFTLYLAHSSRIHETVLDRYNIVKVRRSYNWTVTTICSRKEIKMLPALRGRVYARLSLKGNRHRRKWKKKWKNGGSRFSSSSSLCAWSGTETVHHEGGLLNASSVGFKTFSDDSRIRVQGLPHRLFYNHCGPAGFVPIVSLVAHSSPFTAPTSRRRISIWKNMPANTCCRENLSQSLRPISGSKFEIENGRGGSSFPSAGIPVAGYNHPGDFPFSSQSDLDRCRWERFACNELGMNNGVLSCRRVIRRLGNFVLWQ